MMNRELYLRSIADSLALLSKQVSVRGAISLYDINIVSETFYAGLINLIENYTLVNANTIEKNAPGIDLIDDEHRVSIQVTSDNSSKKIKHTLEEFCNNESYKKYDRLIFLILTEKKRYTTEFDTQGLFSFDKNSDIWDIETLIQRINALPTEKLREINDYLDTELNEKCSKQTEASEIETIIDLIEFITSNRQAKYKKCDAVVDPDYKINKRFKEFANHLKTQYMTLLGVYGSALAEIEKTRGSDDAQDLITMMYLQDLSVGYLDDANDDPIEALNNMVSFFDAKLRRNGKKYDLAAIRFYLINEMIKCNVFPNEGGEYDGG